MLATTREDVVQLLDGLIGQWQIPNLASPTLAIAITPDLRTGEVYPPPGTELLSGVEAVIRIKGISAPTLDDSLQIAVEVVIACPISLATSLGAALQVIRQSGRYLVSGLTPSSTGQSQIFKLTRFFKEN